MTQKRSLPVNWRNLWPLPTTTVMISCVGAEGQPNIITIGACGVVSARPLLVGFAMGVNRYSYTLIKETRDFVVNIPAADQARVVDWCGSVSGKQVDKFEQGRLTPRPSEKVNSPLIAECPVNLECSVWQIVECGSHDFIIGEIQAVHVDDGVCAEDGESLDPGKFDPLVSLQLTYFGLGDALGTWGFSKEEPESA